ncbi:MAG: phosphoribosylamine--glycine ligase [Ardenticatenales bacterium]|nr:phosphoribosylamine--glycine ligase [Ardenticatenales bacterium]
MPIPHPARVLVVGSGGREHALAWAIARSPHVSEVIVAPGNGGTAREAKCRNVPVQVYDIDGLVALASQADVNLTVIGPDDAVAAGLADALRAAGHAVFGPSREAARIESSKGWARAFMARYGIPGPAFATASSVEDALRAVAELGGRCVVKADGLAMGKGVVVCDDAVEAGAAVTAMMEDGAFGPAGAHVVVEERMEGPELSVMAISDGNTYRLLSPAQDHKRVGEGDTGPNTGGMGAYAPAPIATPELMARIEATIIAPALDGLRADGHPFTGCLYAGLMLTGDAPHYVPKVVEFNARFGDPETQVQMPLVQSDMALLFALAAAGRLADAPFDLAPGAAACVVLACPGYPGPVTTGATVNGLDGADMRGGVKVFHAGTRREEDGTEVVRTSGGRALGVTGVGPSVVEALRTTYAAIGPGGVHFDDMVVRHDIGWRALTDAIGDSVDGVEPVDGVDAAGRQIGDDTDLGTGAGA